MRMLISETVICKLEYATEFMNSLRKHVRYDELDYNWNR